MDKDNIPKRERTIGWSIIEAYDFKKPDEGKAKFYDGTPRILLDPDIKPVLNIAGPVICYELSQLYNFGGVLPLIDEAVLVGEYDKIPGVVGRLLPNPKLADTPTPQTELKGSLHVEDIQILITKLIELDLLRAASTYRSSQYQLTPDDETKLSPVTISDIKLAAVYHNTWTAVNDKKYDNAVSLMKPTSGTPTWHYIGTLAVDGIFGDEFSILVFQLECELVLPLKEGKTTKWKIVLGWAPIAIFDLIHERIVEISEKFIRGPGKGINNEKLYESSPQINEDIVISGKVNLSRVTQTISQVTDKNKVGEADDALALANKIARRAQNEEAVKLRLEIQEKERKIQKIKAESELKLAKAKAEMEYKLNQTRFLSTMDQDKDPLFFDPHKENQELITEAENLKRMIKDIQGQKEMLKQIERLDMEGKTLDTTSLKNLQLINPDFDPPPLRELKPGENPFVAREISRADKALLVQSGIRGILDSSEDMKDYARLTEEQVLTAELSDDNQASLFTFQFLAIKPNRKAVMREKVKGMQLAKDGYELPKRIHASFNFFDFPKTVSESMVLEKPNDTFMDQNVLIYGIPFALVREGHFKDKKVEREPIISYEIDPSMKGRHSAHFDFAKYLYQKCLTMDLWDEDSLLYFGTIKIPLRDLMRQGKVMSTTSKEYEIIHPSFNKPKGSIQIMIRNLGQPAKYELPREATLTLKNKSMTFVNETKKKVKSSHKVTISDKYKDAKVDPNLIALKKQAELEEIKDQDDETRKLNRVTRYKFTSSENERNPFYGVSPQEYQEIKKEIENINIYRESKKIDILKQTAQNYTGNDHKTVYVSQGKVEVIPLKVINTTGDLKTFTLKINDPDESVLVKPEITIISNPLEWKLWQERLGTAEPPEWDIIQPNSSTFELKGHTEVEILVKVHSFRTLNDEFFQESKEKRIMDTDPRRREYIISRDLILSVIDGSGLPLVRSIFKLIPRHPVIDHTFRIHEKAGKKNAVLNFPAMYHYTTPPPHKPHLHVTKPGVALEWLNDYEIQAMLSVPKEKDPFIFHMLAYTNGFMSDLIGHWVVEIQPCAGMDILMLLGQLVSVKLSIPVQETTLAQCYVSHPGICYFPRGYDKEFVLPPGNIHEIPMNLRIFNTNVQAVVVNCIEATTRKTLYSWVLNIIGREPDVTRSFEMAMKCGLEYNQKFLFENRSAQFAVFDFVSSNPDILEPLDKSVPIEGGKKAGIRIRLAKQLDPCIVEVCLYATSSEDNIHECLVFQLKYD